MHRQAVSYRLPVLYRHLQAAFCHHCISSRRLSALFRHRPVSSLHRQAFRLLKFAYVYCDLDVSEIRRYLRDYNSIRVSRSLRDIAYKAIYAKENYIRLEQVGEALCQK